MSHLIHFEITAEDPSRAALFYTSVFGWEIAKSENEYWVVTTGTAEEPGIGGAITQRQLPITADNPTAFVCTMDVTDIDEALTLVEQSGGQAVGEKVEMPGVGWHAYCLDTEGNTFGIIQPSDSSV